MSQNPQLITLYSTQPPLRVTGLRGSVPPTPVGGYGGWTIIPRPRRRAMTRWSGINPFQMQLSILFDGFPDTSVEQQCQILEQLAQPPAKRQQPPVVRVIGAVPHPELGYVIGDGQGGDGLSWDQDTNMVVYSERLGCRVRAHCTITLLEYIADDRVSNQSAAARSRQKAAAQAASNAARAGGIPAAKRTYTVRAGDTLFTIAQRILGSAARWTEIAQLNGLASPQSITVGQVVKLPL